MRFYSSKNVEERKIQKYQKKTIGLLSFLFILAITFAFYDRFINVNGGLFCHTVTKNNYNLIEYNQSRVCIGSGADMTSTSLFYMGNEGMYLLKKGDSIISECIWVDDRSFDPVFQRNNIEVNPWQSQICDYYDTVRIKVR